jgi:hypothetical protein
MPGHHGSVTDETNLHRAHAFEYADAAARGAAGGFAAVDVGKLARQLDDNSLWMLVDESPATWVQQTAGGAGGYTDEQAQDAVGAMLADTASINLTYTDATPELKADAVFGTATGTVAEGNHAHAGIATGLTVDLGDGINVITSSEPPVYVKLPFACTVTAWDVIADVSGSITVLVHRAPTATPTTWTEISGASDPALSSQQSASDSAIAGDWGDVTLDANDWLRFTVSGSPATVKRVAVALTLTRSI